MAGPTILQSLRLLEQNKHFWEGWLSFQIQSAIDRSMDFAWLCYASATTLLIYASNKTNTFRLNGSLTTQMINKKCLNDVWCSAGKSLGRFNKFYKYDRPSINHHQHDVGGKERLGKVKWTILLTLTYKGDILLLRLVICKYITNYFKRNNFKVGTKRLWLGAKRPVPLGIYWIVLENDSEVCMKTGQHWLGLQTSRRKLQRNA